MALTSAEIIQCNNYFKEHNIPISKTLEDSVLNDLLRSLKREATPETFKRIQERVQGTPGLTPLEFTVAVSGALWRQDMDNRAQREGVVFNPDADQLDATQVRNLTPAEVTKLKDIYDSRMVGTRGVTMQAVADVCQVLYKDTTPELIHSILLLMPAKVSLGRFLQTSSAIREITEDKYRNLSSEEKQLRNLVFSKQAGRRDSALVAKPPTTMAVDDECGSPKFAGTPNDSEAYRREFGLTTNDVLAEVAARVSNSFSFNDCVVIKKFYDDQRLQYGVNLQPVRLKTMFHQMGKDVSDGGIRVVTHLLNTMKQIHVRDFVLLLAEMINQDGPKLQAQKDMEYQKSMGVDAQEITSEKEFLRGAAVRKQSLGLIRRQSFGDVLSHVAIDKCVKMQNDVEEYRHEFGIFEEPEELLDSCHGMLTVDALVEAKKFYYNNNLHNDNKRFDNKTAVEQLCASMESKSKITLAPPSANDWSNLCSMWREKFLTLSFFEFVTTLSSYLRARARTAEATRVQESLEHIKKFKQSTGDTLTEEEEAHMNAFARTRNERGGSIIGLKPADSTTRGQNALTRRGTTAKSASEYFRDLGVSADEEDGIAADATHGILTPEDVHRLKTRLKEGDLTPWKVRHMLSEIGKDITIEGQEALCKHLLEGDLSLIESMNMIASYATQHESMQLQKEIDTYKKSMGVTAEEERDLKRFTANSFYRHSGVSISVPAANKTDGEDVASPHRARPLPNDADEFRREFGVTARDVCAFLSKQCHGELRTSDLGKLRTFFSEKVNEKNITEDNVKEALQTVSRTLSQEHFTELLQRCTKWKRVMFEDFARMLAVQLTKDTQHRLRTELKTLETKSPTDTQKPVYTEANELATLALQCGNQFSVDELQDALALYYALNMQHIEDKWHIVSFLSGIRKHCTDASIDAIAAQKAAIKTFSQLMLTISNALSKEEKAFRERQLARLRPEAFNLAAGQS